MSYTVEWRGDVQQDEHKNISYFMRLQGIEGGVLIRHASSDRSGNLIEPFKPGDVIEGWELHPKVGKNEKPYWKLERVKQQQWTPPNTTSTTTTGAPVAAAPTAVPTYEDGPPVNPEQARQRAIAAQASQKVAVEVVRMGLGSYGEPQSASSLTREVLECAEKLFDQVESLSKR